MTRHPQWSLAEVSIPKCPKCGTAHWTGTYRVQVERTWSVSDDASEPALEHEDEDFGEWGEIVCSACQRAADGEVRAQVLERLLGA
jgi:hypothetical protein